MVDMFNDEIETVRLNAINSLCKISHHIVLREDQLDIILNVLKVGTQEVGHGTAGAPLSLRCQLGDGCTCLCC